MTAVPPRNITKEFLESEDGAKLIEAIHNISEGVKAFGEFFSWYSQEFKTVKKTPKPKTAARAHKKRQRDPEAPKAPLSSYMLFCRDQREIVKSTMPELNTKQVVAELGKRWKEVDQAVRDKYITEANSLREEFKHEQEEYKQKKASSTEVEVDVQLPPGSDSDEESSEGEESGEETGSDSSSVTEPETKKQKIDPKAAVVKKTATPVKPAEVPTPKAKASKKPEKKAEPVPEPEPVAPTSEKKKKKKKPKAPASPTLEFTFATTPVRAPESEKKKGKKEKA